MKVSHNLFLNSKKFEINLDFKQYLNILSQMNEQIAWKLNHNEDYHIESIVSNETVQDFLEYWVNNNRLPEFNIDNLFEFYFLSEEFGILKDYLSQNNFKEIFPLSFFKYLEKYSIFLRSLSNSFKKISYDKKSHDSFIAKNLDHFIDKYSNKLCELSVNSLFIIEN